MPKKKAAKKGLSGGQKAGIGVGLTAAAVAAAGAYFLYGSPNAKSNRKKVKGWALKAKGEVLEALEKAEKMTEDEFNSLVTSAASAYGKLSKVNKNDIVAFKKEMGEHWQKLEKTAGGAKRKIKKAMKRVTKKK